MIDLSFINHLHLLLNPYDKLHHLECDGLTHVIHRVLSDENIEHTIYTGRVIYSFNDEHIPIHYWIDIDNIRIDYRAKMWLGDAPDIPHGIFYPTDYPSISYQGSHTQLTLLPHIIIQEIINPYPAINDYV
jgi:hypothetical protein